jgi:hypothetical protein
MPVSFRRGVLEEVSFGFRREAVSEEAELQARLDAAARRRADRIGREFWSRDDTIDLDVHPHCRCLSPIVFGHKPWCDLTGRE